MIMESRNEKIRRLQGVSIMTLGSAFYNIPSYITCLFDKNTELLPSVQELFELELAYLEYSVLQKSELLDRLAYCKSINWV